MSVSNEQVVKALRTSVKEAERLRGQNKQLLAKRNEPIAIVGIGCRFPGEVASPRDLWDLVAAGEEGITEFPTDRGWDMDRLYSPDPEELGTTYVRKGGFLHDVAEFDAAFFGIGPREALAMDPQQRLLLEGTWEALEDAGVDPSSLRGTSTGVFVGAVQPDYTAGGMTIAPGMEALLGTGLSGSIASGRIAYTLGLEGPAVTIDTACSSSLVAMHLAAQALRSGECELALAGGVTVHSTLGTFVGMSRQRGLAPDGRPKSYAGAADGTAWGEGCGMVLLERLSVAREKNRRILAVIRGSAVNQDGASNGMIAPNGPSQERVIRQALANAGLAPVEVDAVEGHGTGTPLGDPIEAQALLATYGQERNGTPLQLGSLKSNVGHTVAAAGVGGVIKMVMALREEALPKTLHVDEPTPHVDWSSGEIDLLTEQREWKRGERPRRAGVSSFGISGTNAHLILEEAPAPEDAAEETEQAQCPPAIAWAISAKTPAALREYAGRLGAGIEQSGADPLDVAHTLLASRASLAHRAVVIGSEAEQLLAGLDAVAHGRPAANLVEAKVSHGKTAFLFSGQGCQRAGMGSELHAAFPAYAEAFDVACTALEAELGLDVKAAVFAEEGSEHSQSLSRTDLTQASLFALETALFRLLESFGAKPDYLIGHSIGELAAAHVAGVLPLADAAKLVAVRGRLMAALPAGGAMTSIRATEEEVEESLAAYEGRLAVAAVNAPASIVVSGDEEALAEWEREQERADRKAKRLDVSHAFHSHRMEPMLAEFEKAAQSLTFSAPQIPIVSNLSGEGLTDEQATSPAYWASHVRETVRFAAGIAWLRERGTSRFVELGPDAVLTAIAAECVSEQEGLAFAAALRREHSEPGSFAVALSTLRASGGKADLSALCAGGSLVELPTYPFQRERYWLEPGIGSLDPASLGQAATEHPLLSASISLAREREQVFTGRISVESHPWLADHVVAGTVVVPGTTFCELALRAGAELGIERLEEMVMESPLMLSGTEAVQLQVSVSAGEDDPERFEFAIHSRPEPAAEAEEPELPWARHASGTLVAEPEPLALGFDASAWPPPGAEPVEVDAFYDLTEGAGFEYGPAFQGLEAAWRLGGEIYGEISLGEDQQGEAENFGIHPALLDAALHPALIEAVGSEGGLRLPFSFSGVSLGAGRGAAQLRVRVRVEDERLTLAAADPAGEPVCAITSLAMRPVESFALEARSSQAGDLFQRAWEPVELPVGGEDVPVELHRLVAAGDLDPAQAAHQLSATVLAAIQAFLAAEDGGESRLAFVSEGAVASAEGELCDPAVAAAWGLVRSAQAEHPGRFVLVDSDGSEESERALAAAAAAEPEVVLRGGRASVPRLVPTGSTSVEAPRIDPKGTVLVSGGLSGLGALAAAHLAEAHGARHLLLAGRGGADSAGAEELVARLAALGAEATVVSCDVTDRAQVEALLDGVPAAHPLTAIVHCAGVLDDGTVESLDAERLDRVLAPKVDGAWNLHELSAGGDLAAFVLYSSAAAAFGSPGQGNYAAANAFLDALAQTRRAEGLPATSIAWGMWETGMAAGLGEAERARLGRTGLTLIDAERGADLFDRALALGAASPVAVPLDRGALRALDGAGLLPPILSGLVPAARRRSKVAAGSLARRLAEVPEADREALVLQEVQGHVAGILGHSSADAVDPEANFKDLGFDSLGAVELRNRLSQATGVRLEATLVFDHPSSAAIASYLVRQVDAGASAAVAVRTATGSDEPVAIVGIGCRFPGGATTPQEFWRLVADGRDGISEFPTDRGWEVERLYDPDPARAGKSYVREGGFLDDAASFDPAFFGIGPREALAMDPQQRLLLEGAWEAVQDAGIDPASLRGSATGVFAGVMMADYAAGGAALSAAGLEGFGTGIAGSVASGRIAYTLGLEGPAVTIDTACSSSLVAMHLAAQALRGGECDLALAGGATILSTPAAFVEFSRQRVFAPDGRAKSFAASADGTAWGEGMGLLLLERLSDAKANGHRILAVIRGSATNQDGASNGLTAPNGPSQERVIRQALANAGLKPAEIDAVEAHGTGTVLGDPIEAQALLATYGQERDGAPLALGSLKSNFGHTQAAAGVGGVIKMVMALREGALPRTLHVDEPTPHVDWDSGEVELLTEQRPWPRGERPRRAGVSSFGISGTNAHLIVEEPPEPPAPEREQATRPSALPWALSAKTPEALREYAGRLAAHVEQAGEDPLDVAQALLASRASLPQRAVVVGEDTADLLAGLNALAQGREHPALARGRATSRSKVAFVFPGQGSQWAGMGAQLLAESEVFATAIAECEAALAPHVEWSLRAVLGAGSEDWSDQVDVVQPTLFATMIGLARLWGSFGVKPSAVIGHSQGEIAAAVVAGALSLEDGAKLAALRAKALLPLIGKGEMASLVLPPPELEAMIEPYGDRVAVAAHNAPGATVLSGEPAALAELIAACEAEGRPARLLPVGYASHCAQVEEIETELRGAIADIVPQQAEIPIYSTVTAGILDPADLTADYWYRNLREPVEFAAATAALLDDGFSTIVEVSSHPVLSLALQESAEASTSASGSIAVLHTLRRDDGGLRRFLISAGDAYAQGVPVDFGPLFRAAAPSRVDLPTYPFQRERFWLEASLGGGDPTSLGQRPTAHPLLGASIALAREGEHLFTGRLSQGSHPWMTDHAVAGAVILPGTAFCEMALCAGLELGAERLVELVIGAPLLLPAQETVRVQLSASPSATDPERFDFTIHSQLEGSESEDSEGDERPWVLHASGVLAAQEQPLELGFDPTAWPPPGAEPIDIDGFYDRAAQAGIEYGPALQGLETAWSRDGEVYGEVSLAPEQQFEAERFLIHPALLDAALQAGMAAVDPADFASEARLPFAWSGVAVRRGTRPTRLRVRVRPTGESASIEAAGPDGQPICTIDGIHARRIDPAVLRAGVAAPDDLFGLEWVEVDLREVAAEQIEIHRIPAAAEGEDRAAAAHALTAEVLDVMQDFLADEDRADACLAIVTEGVASVHGEGPVDPAAAAVAGLVRSAQFEHPGRIALVDTDGHEASEAALLAAASDAAEPQIALRAGAASAPRLRVLAEESDGPAPPAWSGEGTVLITGGLSGLGALVARHLAAEHGARHLLLASRRGPEAPGAKELLAELAALDCEATAAVCDVSDPAQLKRMLAAIPSERPLRAVVHCAGALDDGLIMSLNRERLDTTLAPKADAAWHLHELTAGMDIAAFVLFSSVAGVFGKPGQGNYAAASSFLDALAERRRAEGLPATSISWGLWEMASELTGHLEEQDRSRLNRLGFGELGPELGMGLFDRACGAEEPHQVAVPIERPALGRLARAGMLPALFTGLAPSVRRRPRAAAGALARRLEGVGPAEREEIVLAEVREHVAAILGHSSPDAIEKDRNLLELGFDSLGAVELRSRLAAAADLQIPPSVAFEHPTPAALAVYLVERLAEHGDDAVVPPSGADVLAGGGGATLRDLIAHAHGEGRAVEAVPLLVAASRFRPSFDSLEELGEPTPGVAIAAAGEAPHLVCVPSFVVGSGPHQFARVGRALDGNRKVTALSLPGSRRGESLPASWDAALEALAESALRAVGDEPYVLVGYSSGGAVARALAERLELSEWPPAGLVMIDSYLPVDARAGEVFATVVGQLLEMDHEAVAIDDDHLIAMGAYMRILLEWEPGLIAAPGVMLRASDGSMAPADDGELPEWQRPEDTVEVAGSHLSLIADDAPATAGAIEAWLARRLAPQSAADLEA